MSKLQAFNRSVLAKIGRAEEHASVCDAEILSWIQSGPYNTVRKQDLDGRRHSVVLQILNPPSLERWSLIAADCVHNLRSALDHLVYGIAAHESRQNPPADARRLQFPIEDTPDNYLKAAGRIRSLSLPVRAMIESLQPYNRPHATLPPPLSILGAFDNVDKHRLVHLALHRVAQGWVKHAQVHGIKIVQLEHNSGGLEDGTALVWFLLDGPEPDAQYEFEALITITVDHQVGPTGLGVGQLNPLLQVLIDEVKYVVDQVGSQVVP